MKPIVFVPEPIAAAGIDLLRGECDLIAPWLNGHGSDAVERKIVPPAAEAVLVRLFPVRSQQLAAAGQLKVIAKHGVGVDNIDVPAATARRIPVVFTPHANSNAVVEHTLALMLALARNLHVASNALLAGRFQDRSRIEGVELAGKTLGVVGLGRVGARVAEAARQGFGMQVLAYDPFVSTATYSGTAQLESSLDKLLAAADFLTLHMPLTPQTQHLIDDQRIELLKPTCRIINTSRGAIINDAALARALHKGRLAGAALDVFDQEPLPADHPFLSTPNMLLTPHIASSTKESLDRMARDAAQGVLDVLHGKRAAHVVNPEVWGMSQWIDVTRPYDERLPTWPGRKRPDHNWVKSLAAGDRANVSFWQLNAHSGTHMDAPLHFIAGGKSIDRIPPEVFIGPCQVVDLERLTNRVFDADVARQHVGVQRLLIKTEYSRPQPPDHYQPHPGLMTDEATKLLLAGGLLLVGTDRLSVDDPSNDECPLHYRILGAGCVIVEGLWLAAVSPGEFYLSAAPLRLTGTEASPLRAFLSPTHDTP